MDLTGNCGHAHTRACQCTHWHLTRDSVLLYRLNFKNDLPFSPHRDTDAAHILGRPSEAENQLDGFLHVLCTVSAAVSVLPHFQPLLLLSVSPGQKLKTV